jgi:cyclophilin family peptidyl-prolyl cis-trans isomerase
MSLSLRLAPLAALLLLLAGCGGDDTSSSGTTAADTTATAMNAAACEEASAPPSESREAEAPAEPLDTATTYDVVIETNCGSFTIRLDPVQSPQTTASFVALVEGGYYDETVFHRIVPGFVIQGGDPTASGAGGPGYQTVDEPPPDATYPYGTVAMAKSTDDPPGAAGSQFFVVTAPDAGLPPEYAIIGTVTEGLETVDRIGLLGDESQQPTEVVEIRKATVETT